MIRFGDECWSEMVGAVSFCGSSEDLQVHHQQFRSKFGNDELNNLISLCARCHRQQHGRLR